MVQNVEKLYESQTFIHASHQEGFPNSIVEALNFNLPVLLQIVKVASRNSYLWKGDDLFPIIITNY